MKRDIFKKSAVLMLLTALFAGDRALSAPSYPPDNAAVLDYKLCLMYQSPEGEINAQLKDLIAGKSKPTDELTRFIAAQGYTIDTVIAASQISDCDWGHDYSKGFAMILPALSDMRNITYIVLADAVIKADKGDTADAIDNCIASYRMAQHVRGRILIENLVGIAMEQASTKVVANILSTRAVDAATLKKLNTALAEIAAANTGLLACIQSEIDAVTKYSSPAEIAQIVIQMEDEDAKVSDYDKGFPEKGIAYYKEHMSKMLNAVQLPYRRCIAEMQKLEKQIDADAKKKPEAMVAAALIPNITSVVSLDVKARTAMNALRTAVEIYLVNSSTGKLPESLPAGMPKDLFSNKDFEYSAAKGGFTLRCRATNLKSDEVEEYVFSTIQ